ncbi:unnamed protein product [Sphagnum tenellum]
MLQDDAAAKGNELIPVGPGPLMISGPLMILELTAEILQELRAWICMDPVVVAFKKVDGYTLNVSTKLLYRKDLAN